MKTTSVFGLHTATRDIQFRIVRNDSTCMYTIRGWKDQNSIESGKGWNPEFSSESEAMRFAMLRAIRRVGLSELSADKEFNVSLMSSVANGLDLWKATLLSAHEDVLLSKVEKYLSYSERKLA